MDICPQGRGHCKRYLQAGQASPCRTDHRHRHASELTQITLKICSSWPYFILKKIYKLRYFYNVKNEFMCTTGLICPAIAFAGVVHHLWLCPSVSASAMISEPWDEGVMCVNAPFVTEP